MIKRVIDEKIKQYQKLKESYEKNPNPLDLFSPQYANELIITLINMAINDLETIKFLYLHELKNKEKTNDKTSIKYYIYNESTDYRYTSKRLVNTTKDKENIKND